MPELPEIFIISGQMAETIIGKRIVFVDIKQPKCLNVSVDDFRKILKDNKISSVTCKGKWIIIKAGNCLIEIHLGMGGDILYFTSENIPTNNYHYKMGFNDKSGFTIRFWWFGKIYLYSNNNIDQHEIFKLGITPLNANFTLAYLHQLMRGKKQKIKAFLLNQKYICGIGNVYIQEILFISKLHPLRRISTLKEKEIGDLYNAILSVLKKSIKMKGLAYEKDFFGQPGKYSVEEMSVGYKEGKKCQLCGNTIEKITTGSTSTYICPSCQRL